VEFPKEWRNTVILYALVVDRTLAKHDYEYVHRPPIHLPCPALEAETSASEILWTPSCLQNVSWCRSIRRRSSDYWQFTAEAWGRGCHSSSLI